MTLTACTVILLLIVVVSAIGLYSRPFIARTLLRPYLIARGRHWDTLITSGFVHADLGHLIFNLITLYSFGFLLERAIGPLQFVYWGRARFHFVAICPLVLLDQIVSRRQN